MAQVLILTSIYSNPQNVIIFIYYFILFYSFNYCHVTYEVVSYVAVIRVTKRPERQREALRDDPNNGCARKRLQLKD